MIESLKRFLAGKTGPSALPGDFSGSALRSLRQELKSFNESKRGLGDRLFAFVVSGGDETSLLDLRGLSKSSAGGGSRSFGYGSSIGVERRTFLRNLPLSDGGLLYRLARVYEAEAAVCGNSPSRLGPGLGWLESFLSNGAQACSPNYYYQRSGGDESKPAWTAAHIESMMAAAGSPPDSLVRAVLSPVSSNYEWDWISGIVIETMGGLGKHFSSHPDSVVSILRAGDARQNLSVLRALSATRTTVAGTLRDEMVELSVGRAKTVREASETLLRVRADSREAVVNSVTKILEEGTPAARRHAVGLLARLAGEEAHAYLSSRLDVEKAPKVKSEIEKYLQIQSDVAPDPDSESQESTPYEDGLEAPPPRSYETHYTLSPAAREKYEAAIRRFNEGAKESHRKWFDRCEPSWRRGQRREIDDPVSSKTAAVVWEAISEPIDTKKKRKLALLSGRREYHYGIDGPSLARELGSFVRESDLELVPIIRLAYFSGQIKLRHANEYWSNRIDDDAIEWLSHHLHNKEPATTLADLAAAFETAGLTTTPLERLFLDWGWQVRFNPLGLSNDAIWPHFLTRLDTLEEALRAERDPKGVPDYYLESWRASAFKVLATFPRPPKQLAALLWEHALGTARKTRGPAQACLGNYPGREQYVIAALDDGRKDLRASAAEWLGRLGDPSAVKPLQKALKSEKHPEPKAAIMESLEQLGADVDKFLNRKQLLSEAEKGLKKPIPANLEWFPFDQLPEARWEKNRHQVAPEILRWFVVQAFKLKKPEPGPLLRRYCAMIQPDQRQDLGRIVLQAWIAEDTRPAHNHEEAAQLAEAEVVRTRGYAKNYPQYYANFNEEAYRRQVINHYMNECVGSAIKSKGVLAVAAACCGPDAVPLVQKYLKDHYGKRLAQCKALIQMISWVEHPLAIQLLLSVATRFRTRSIQKEAGRYVDILAERNGWSRDELADRTIPTAGFESDGTQELDYGPRQFQALLADDFSIQLFNPDGKAIKSLPSPASLDDEATAKATKKSFSAAKRELKQVLKLQKERLYEAMCVRREWSFEDWQTFLLNHPIVGRHCQRLIWMSTRDDELVATFRPLADRTLTDADDGEVFCKRTDRILLAHDAVLPAELTEAWRQHQIDYEVDPLFEQFSGSDLVPDEKMMEASDISSYQGHVVNSYKLRSRATKLGYQRGQAEDGGWFMTYLKDFPGLRLQAVIEFTGNTLPEEDRLVALTRLYFTRTSNEPSDMSIYSHRPVKLGELPSILVSECWKDLRAMAADGSGFDPNWKKSTGW